MIQDIQEDNSYIVSYLEAYNETINDLLDPPR